MGIISLVSRSVERIPCVIVVTLKVRGPSKLPGIAPTNRHVEVPLVPIVHFRDGKLAHEHIYWDQASVLKQIGLLTDSSLPAYGAETARKVIDPKFSPVVKN